ncbi:hypothetical protein FQN53_003282 [Emmonsiellopsis sp. PD_33]|nr:hypothetical protein FQN53_003282 [Emmonsiellopsis sp. PD_33]
MAPPIPQPSPPPNHLHHHHQPQSTPPYPYPYPYPHPAPSPHPLASLSHLPPELKFQILTSLPDLPSLRSLIKASPSFHALYLHDQRRILRTLLARVIPQPVLVEVALVSALKREGCAEEEGESFAERFLERYEGLRGVLKGEGEGLEGNGDEDGEVRVNGVRFWYSKAGRDRDRDRDGNGNGNGNGGLSIDFSSFTLAELREVVRQHYIVHSIAEDTARSCLRVNPFTKEAAMDSYNNNEPMLALSETETYRIHRALYRVQILAHLYRVWCVRDPNYYTAFLKSFPPWEREEIHCLRNYMYKAFLDICSDGDVSNSCEGAQESAGIGRRLRSRKRRRGSDNRSDSDFEFDLAIDDQREHCLTLGLEFLWQWLHHPVPPTPIANTDDTNTNYATAIIRKKPRSTRLPIPLPIHIPLHPPSPSTPPSTPNSPTNTHPQHPPFPPNTRTPPTTFLTRALNPSISLGFFRPIVNSALETFTTDTAWHRPNLGWTSLHERNTKYSAQARNAYCRGWGYVFWDEGRLRGLGLGKGDEDV